ncbi:MAG TPA: FixH family protein [Ardenticatenaceae bacterium]|nr:FixH family protein [Ardenticatenaceae bacterium]
MSSANPVAVPHTTPVRKPRRPLFWAGITLGGLFLAAAIGMAVMMWRMSYVPSDLDLSTTRLSDNGLFRGSYVSRADPIEINQIHSWTLHVAAPDGAPVENAEIRVDGDMPQHGHGLPTQPLVTQNLGNGDYLVEGMKFQMTGWWVVDFYITADGHSDMVRFNLLLK